MLIIHFVYDILPFFSYRGTPPKASYHLPPCVLIDNYMCKTKEESQNCCRYGKAETLTSRLGLRSIRIGKLCLLCLSERTRAAIRARLM